MKIGPKAPQAQMTTPLATQVEQPATLPLASQMTQGNAFQAGTTPSITGNQVQTPTLQGGSGLSSLQLQMGGGTRDLQASVEQSLADHEVGFGKGEQHLLFGPPLEKSQMVPVKLPQLFAFLSGGLGGGALTHQIDYPERTAFVDTANQEFFLNVQSPNQQQQGGDNFWFGPFPLKN